MKTKGMILYLILTLLISGCVMNENQNSNHSNLYEYDIFSVLREGTPDETEVYYYSSGQLGPKIFIIGGTHGDETAGYLAAEELLSFFPQNGEVMIIPKANKQAVEMNSRKSENNIDLNRSYPGSHDGNEMEILSHEIFSAIEAYSPDVVIDLHESLDFYTNGRLGNSIILGIEGEHMLKLLSLLEYINEVETEEIEFTFFGNPPTHSLNESVSNLLKIPVYTIETCRENSIEKRVRQQVLLAKKIIELYGKE
jgi:predicted deacylase